MSDLPDKDDIKVVILAGGRGTRAYPHTDYLPKPMLPVNGKPIIMHVMQIFAARGYRKFVLSVGYRSEVIKDYFANKSLDWEVEIEHTGDETDTGGRIANCKHLLGSTFMATYSDGLAKVPFDDLIAFHHQHAGLATVTSVPLTSQYGTIDSTESGRILSFNEKPTLREHWINCGFMVFNRDVFDHWEGENLEREVLPRLSEKGLAYTYHSDAFFKSMDTYKDQQDIEELCRSGQFD
ncbi:MAG: sugar phosphate nucleotidyltransferase [Gammaproteobacteria bacterium]|nr:sugar phosphate nucleotidyltransferase [Gammaproteobacteria bacterium]MDH3469492.1 sugar phosphate nucleotidyltransferase [Gammaproteobacteria bacterium]